MPPIQLAGRMLRHRAERRGRRRSLLTVTPVKPAHLCCVSPQTDYFVHDDGFLTDECEFYRTVEVGICHLSSSRRYSEFPFQREVYARLLLQGAERFNRARCGHRTFVQMLRPFYTRSTWYFAGKGCSLIDGVPQSS